MASLCAATLVTSSCGGGRAGGDGAPDADPNFELEVEDARQEGGVGWEAELAQLRNTPVQFAPSAEVGALPARSWTDDNGGAHYSIPIDVAPGPNGFAPSLSLHYSSAGGNGLYGVGFSVAAGSHVQRCQRTLAKDGYYEELHMDETDPVCYGGQRLILDSGTYGEAGSVYRLETDLSKRFRLTVGGLDTGGGGIWELDTADGQTLLFRDYDWLRGRWLLDRVTDSFGNRMDYNWDQLPNHEFVLESILYGRPGVEAPGRRKVIFETENRTDVREGYIRGQRYELTQRVREIRSEAPYGEVVSRYSLSYDIHPDTRQSVLSQVKRLDAADAELPPTVFDWTREDADSIENGAHGDYGPWHWLQDFPTIANLRRSGVAAIGDFNGDDATDVLVYDAGDDAYLVNGEPALLGVFESTRPGGWGEVESDAREGAEHTVFLDLGLPSFDFDTFLASYRGLYDEELFDSEAQYEAFVANVRSLLGDDLDDELHKVQPSLGLARIKFSTEDKRDQIIVPIAPSVRVVAA